MIWYIIHNILKTIFPNMDVQHRNLTTFLTGVVLYTLFYSYVGTLGREHLFLNVFFKYSIYILIADGFAMAILYKNFYKQTIFKEVEETLGTSGPKQTAANVEPIMTVEAVINDSANSANDTAKPKKKSKKKEEQILPVLLNENENNYNIENEGFAMDSALGDFYTTNGVSNSI